VKVAPAVTDKLSDAEFYAKVRASSKLLTGNDASLDAARYLVVREPDEQGVRGEVVQGDCGHHGPARHGRRAG